MEKLLSLQSDFVSKKSFLILQKEAAIRNILDDVLFSSLGEFFSRPKKNFRSQLVELGFSLVSSRSKPKGLKVFQEALESIHGGSLIIDDIEDGSLLRRGKPSFHLLHGVSKAINAGNYLYFLPLKKVSDAKNILPEQKRIFFEFYQEALYRAHLGQTIDLTISISKVPRSDVHSVTLASLELKTGSLTSLALKLGALLGTVNLPAIRAIEEYGIKFGVALQMLDDLGNFLGHGDPVKQKEDLLNGRPTWVWACVSKSEGDLWKTFLRAYRNLPDLEPMHRWIAKNEKAVLLFKEKAKRHLRSARQGLLKKNKFLNTELLKVLEERLLSSYG